jgi:hypothetical protein
MIEWLKNITISSRIDREIDEREKMARLEQAERDLADLKDRKDRAMGILIPRQERNHWQEAIQQMIMGA